jgi:hypothetical protein
MGTPENTTDGLVERKEVVEIAAPEAPSENEPSPEEFSGWTNAAEENFKSDTVAAAGTMNSVGLDDESFRSLKEESGIEAELSAIDKEAENTLASAKSEINEQVTEPREIVREETAQSSGYGKEAATVDRSESSPVFIESDPRYASIQKELNDKRIQELIKRDKDITRTQRIDDMTTLGYSDKSYNPDQEKSLWNLEFRGDVRKGADGTFSAHINPDEISREFAQKYPDDYKAYEAKEKDRIYEDYVKDPAYLQMSRDAFDVYKRDDQKAWGDFAVKYPEKAEAYRKYNQYLDKALGSKNKNAQNIPSPIQTGNQLPSIAEDSHPELNDSQSEEIQGAKEGLIKNNNESTSSQEKNLENPVQEEVLNEFKKIGLPLNETLTGMINESSEHQGGRRGSGFTQLSRQLAERVRLSGADRGVTLFDSSVISDLEDQKYANNNEDLKTTQLSSLLDKEKILGVYEKAKDPGSKLALGMMIDLLGFSEKDPSVPELPFSKDKMEIGTCTTAENYFFDYLKGSMYKDLFSSGQAKMNVIVDSSGQPLFMEKIGVGESHSAISLRPTYINGVKIPAGSLVALQYESKGENKKETASHEGSVINMADIKAFEFLRFTTLAVDPKDREKTFGEHLKWQKENKIAEAETIQLQDFVKKAQEEIS